MRLIIRDIKYQFYNIKKFIFLYMILIAGAIFFMNDYSFSKEDSVQMLFDSFLVDAGFFVRDNTSFMLPVGWLLLHVLPVFSVLLILNQDHEENGIYLLIKTTNKYKYFFSKLVTIFFVQFVYFILMFVPLILFYLHTKNTQMMYIKQLTRICLSFFIENSLLTAIVFIISIYFDMRIAIISLFAMLGLAMIMEYNFIIAQASLVKKQDFSVQHGYTFKSHIEVWFVYLDIIILSMYIKLKKYNFYGSKE